MKSDSREFIENHKKEFVLIAITVFSTFILVSGLRFISGTTVSNGSLTANIYVPVKFLEARIRAANAADKLADLTEQSAANLSSISGADQRGDYVRGLELVTAEIERGRDIRNTAVDLSEELRDMANGLATVTPKEATAVGFAAVTTGIELVQRFVSYNNNLQELFNTLEARLENEGDEHTRARINELIDALNEEAIVINNLGSEYKNLMIQFDGLTNNAPPSEG